jgi:carbonic anhydrase/acetyltransferase-like protein (isoleucine patch superfamily)
VHGAVIGSNVLIGMGSTLMDNAQIPDYTIVGAGSLVLTGAILEPYSIYAGVPARKVKSITAEQAQDMIVRNAQGYLMYKDWYK